MKKVIPLLLSVSMCLQNLQAQKIFQKVDLQGNPGAITSIAQDRLGYIWIAFRIKGLARYDGSKFITYTHNDKDTNSISGVPLEAIAADSSGNIWIGTLGNGMDRFDPATNIFKHFRHNAKDPGSISHDSVNAILQDHLGNIWVGTNRGLDRYDRKNAKIYSLLT